MPNGNVLVVNADHAAGQSIDQALTRRGYKSYLTGHRQETTALARAINPNVIIIDIDSPRIQAAALCSELRSFTMSPIIVLGSDKDESDIVVVLAVGADIALSKPVPNTILLAHVDAAIRRETTYRRHQSESECLYIRDLTVDLAGCELRRDGEAVSLSPMEFRLMRVLALNAGRVLTRDQLLNSVWDVRGDQVYSRTVDVHIGRLRRKIEDDPCRPRYIATVPGVGYKMIGES